MDRLIPFKVRVVPSFRAKTEELSGEERKVHERWVTYWEKLYADLINKDWTVVGVSGDFFLLTRNGELAQWARMEDCEVTPK